jgi:uncharacterized protein DUF3558
MLRRFVPLVAFTLLLAGCSGDPAPAPAKETPSATSSAAESPKRPTEAPAIAQPLDMGPGARHACDTLTAAQQKQLGFRQGTENGGKCGWANGYALQLRVDSDVLADAYAKSNDPEWGVFEPREVHGQPAVVRAAGTDGDSCEVVVGMAPGQGVVLTGKTKPDPKLCDRLVTAAGLVVETLSRWAGV